jgi:hypothetical protein
VLNIKSHICLKKKVLIEIKPPGRALVWLPEKYSGFIPSIQLRGKLYRYLCSLNALAYCEFEKASFATKT